MRKLALVFMAFVLMLSVAAMAQETGTTGTTDKKTAKAEKKQAKAEKKEAKAAEKGKAMHLTGWVKTEGDKIVFVNEKDNQTWDVKNPEMVKPMEGKRVKIKANIDEADKSITVDNVKELKTKQAKMNKEKKS